MTNSESLGAESATAPTTKPESADLNMSAGAEMLIERMKTNPEDFRYGGKFYRVVDAVNAKGQGWISDRDWIALRDAYDVIVKEAEFSEWVYGEIFNPKEPELASPQMYTQNLARSLQQTKNAIAGGVFQSGFSDPHGIYGTNAMNTAMGNNALLGNGALTVSASATTSKSPLKFWR